MLKNSKLSIIYHKNFIFYTFDLQFYVIISRLCFSMHIALLQMQYIPLIKQVEKKKLFVYYH